MSTTHLKCSHFVCFCCGRIVQTRTLVFFVERLFPSLVATKMKPSHMYDNIKSFLCRYVVLFCVHTNAVCSSMMPLARQHMLLFYNLSHSVVYLRLRSLDHVRIFETRETLRFIVMLCTDPSWERIWYQSSLSRYKYRYRPTHKLIVWLCVFICLLVHIQSLECSLKRSIKYQLDVIYSQLLVLLRHDRWFFGSTPELVCFQCSIVGSNVLPSFRFVVLFLHTLFQDENCWAYTTRNRTRGNQKPPKDLLFVSMTLTLL